ncbi:MAG: tetratricopeptide repeat protein [Flavobacteriales bacterium]|nr:tetratricopeptide repeat protein [Flavobacteriales bacterium]MCX7649243.1 tetratricopeptide repeat protein [Flavobacteriales bacterium]MDW8431970.1 tetratricopeptide repeat protein [Flavobacteriales bacterium]
MKSILQRRSFQNARLAVLAGLLCISRFELGAQVDTIEIKKQYSICKEYMSQKNYVDALPAWRFLYQNAPERYQGIYVWGNELFKDLIKKEKDPSRQKGYVDTIMMLHDKRIELASKDPQKFGDVGDLKGRKAFDMINLRKDSEDEIFQLLKESVELRKEKSSAAILSSYMQYAFNFRRAGKMDCEQLVSLYGTLSEYVQAGFAEKKDSAYIKAQNNLDKLAEVCMDCKNLVDIYQKSFDKKKADADWIQKAASNLERKECHKKDEFKTLPVVGQIFQENARLQGTADAFYKLAVFYFGINQNKEGETFLQKAVDLEQDAEKKAQYLYLQATLRFQAKEYAEARSLARRAIQLRPNWGDPYILIGDMYRQSSCGDDACSKGGPAWAAVDKYVQARQADPSCADKVASRLAAAQNLYPSQSECFFLSLKDGDSYRVGCWIDESTTVRTKKD